MIYLDYSATTPVNKEVLDTFNKVTNDFIGNANSLYSLGLNIKMLIDSSTNQIKELLDLKDHDIIYTSGSSEANNLAIKGIINSYKNRGKHIITTPFEHSSVIEPIRYLEKNGCRVSILKYDKNGIIDLDNLESLISEDTVLVSINAVNSEIGIIEPIEEIGKLLKKYPKCFFHVDMTQAIGKVQINLDDVDLFSFSAHKIYGLKGIGALVKKKSVNIEPLIHGGKSTTIYRSGTPCHPLIASFSKALRLSLQNINEKYKYITLLKKQLIDSLALYNDVYINSNDSCIPHILNISVVGIKAETFMHSLEKHNIFISTKSACSDSESISENVFSLTNDIERAKSSIRISLSHLTTKDEIDCFLKYFKECYKSLKI